MLGGDNIDLALAHHVEKKLGGVRLDTEQWSALRFACRTAKEKLLGDAARTGALAGDDRRPRLEDHRRQHPVGADARRGRRRSRSTGSSPGSPAARSPSAGPKLGLQEFGLPFVADPAVPKHLSHFLRRHRAEAIGPEGHQPDDRPARPDAILFNGGALTPESVRDRIVEVVDLMVPGRSRPALRAAGADQCLARPGRGPGRGLLRRGPPRRRNPDRRRHGAVVLRRARDRGGRASPGSASFRATPRRGTRSRSTTTTSTS